MKVFTFFKYVCAVFGLTLIIAAVYLFREKFHLIKTVVDAQGPIALVVFGIAFFFIGFIGLRADDLERKRMNFLQQNGKRITTKFIDVQLNSGVSLNDSNPYFICSEWLNPKTNEINFFESDDIWFNPTDFIKEEEIEVIIDPKDFTNYWMDISFLPKKE